MNTVEKKRLTYQQGLRLMAENAELKSQIALLKVQHAKELKDLENRKSEEVEGYRRIAEQAVWDKTNYKKTHDRELDNARGWAILALFTLTWLVSLIVFIPLT